MHMGSGPVPGPTLKTALCQICTLGREYDKYREGILSLGDARQETSLGIGLLEKIVAGKKEFLGRSCENHYFQRRNSAVHLLLR